MVAFLSRALRTGIKAGIAKKVIDELRKPENQERLKVIAARVAAEVRKPQNQERVRRLARSLRERRAPGV